MSRKTLEQKIEERKAKIAQAENELKGLLQEQKEQERTARTNRLCKRAGLLEKMLPDTIKLTDEQFEMFLKRTTANSFGRKELQEIIQQKTKTDTIPQGETPTQNGEVTETESDKTESDGGSVSAHGAEKSTGDG